VLVDLQGRTEIIEYSELTAEQAARRNDSGQWIFWAGNTAIHVFDRQFLESLCETGNQLPLHIARKQVPCVDEYGQPLPADPSGQPNAIKLERFIFDALPLAARTLIVEGNREREFNPVKNKSGSDSAETCRAALSRIAREWLQAAGHPVGPHEVFELSPLQALDAEQLSENLQRGVFSPEQLLRG
ncbi:MAG: UDPGP type 1 family protein, partial [Planctomyces sp.]